MFHTYNRGGGYTTTSFDQSFRDEHSNAKVDELKEECHLAWVAADVFEFWHWQHHLKTLDKSKVEMDRQTDKQTHLPLPVSAWVHSFLLASWDYFVFQFGYFTQLPKELVQLPQPNFLRSGVYTPATNKFLLERYPGAWTTPQGSTRTPQRQKLSQISLRTSHRGFDGKIRLHGQHAQTRADNVHSPDTRTEVTTRLDNVWSCWVEWIMSNSK